MARDLNSFISDHRKSVFRFKSSFDSLIEKYEDVNETEDLDSVVDLSSCNVVTDRKGVFRGSHFEFRLGARSRCKDHGKRLSCKERQGKQDQVNPGFEKIEDNYDDKFESLQDVTYCVAKCLEEGEPEPSDAETLSSTSSDSYETVTSDFENGTVGSSLQDDLDQDSTGETDDSIDLHDESDEISSQEDRHCQDNPDCVEKRINETFVVEGRLEANLNQKGPYSVGSQTQSASLQTHPAQLQSAEHHNLHSNRPAIRRVTTEYVPFEVYENIQRKESALASNRRSGKEEQNNIYNNDDIEIYPIKEPQQKRPEHTDEPCVDRLNNCTDKLQNPQNSASVGETTKSYLHDNDWLNVKFDQVSAVTNHSIDAVILDERLFNSPKHQNKAVLNLDLKPSPRRNSQVATSFSKELHRSNTPLHHRQAKNMHRMSSEIAIATNPGFHPNNNKTGNEFIDEDNRSSKKDSGISTLHDESVEKLGSPSWSEHPEALTLENIDQFNHSLAEQSTFINVSMNCSKNKSAEKEDKVEKWLHNVSVEMKKEHETTIDKKFEKIYRASSHPKSATIVNNDEFQHIENKIKISEGRNSSRKTPNQKSGKAARAYVDSRSCEGLVHSGHKRTTVKGKRSLTPSLLFQRLKEDQIADLMRNTEKQQLDNEEQWAYRRGNTDLTGKRPGNMYEEAVNIHPTPPKSRRLTCESSDLHSYIQTPSHCGPAGHEISIEEAKPEQTKQSDKAENRYKLTECRQYFIDNNTYTIADHRLEKYVASNNNEQLKDTFCERRNSAGNNGCETDSDSEHLVHKEDQQLIQYCTNSSNLKTSSHKQKSDYVQRNSGRKHEKHYRQEPQQYAVSHSYVRKLNSGPDENINFRESPSIDYHNDMTYEGDIQNFDYERNHNSINHPEGNGRFHQLVYNGGDKCSDSLYSDIKYSNENVGVRYTENDLHRQYTENQTVLSKKDTDNSLRSGDQDDVIVRRFNDLEAHDSRNRNENKHRENRRSTADLKTSESPVHQRRFDSSEDLHYSSPSHRKGSIADKHGSPNIQRTKAELQEENRFSPSSSFAKLKLNTPKSRKSKQEKLITNLRSEYNDRSPRDRRNGYSQKQRDEEFSRNTEINTMPRFISLDELKGMPAQLRIQSARGNTASEASSDYGEIVSGAKYSNEYFNEDLFRVTRHGGNEQIRVDQNLNNPGSNIYHAYCNVIDENSNVERKDNRVSRINNKNEEIRNVSSEPKMEPKMRKSLFAPINSDQMSRNQQSMDTFAPPKNKFDDFKMPMSPSVVPQGRPDRQNKENEHKNNHQTSQKNTLGRGVIKPSTASVTPLEHMQSTPIKPGIQFKLNTTMSTILGSDEHDNDYEDEIMLVKF